MGWAMVAGEASQKPRPEQPAPPVADAHPAAANQSMTAAEPQRQRADPLDDDSDVEMIDKENPAGYGSAHVAQALFEVLAYLRAALWGQGEWD